MERIFGKIKRAKRKLDGKRITAKVMSAVLIASSMLNAFGPVAAYALNPRWRPSRSPRLSTANWHSTAPRT